MELSEEEKKAVELIYNFKNYFLKNKEDGNKANLIVLGEEIEAITTILGLIEKQQKEINRLKDILGYTRKIVNENGELL